MKLTDRHVTILCSLICIACLLTMGAATVLYPRQIGNTPAAGDLLQCTDPTTPADWVARTTICCDLDEAYDAGNEIDFSGAVPIEFDKSASVGSDHYFLYMYTDGIPSFAFATGGDANIFRVFDVNGNLSVALNGFLGMIDLNIEHNPDGDFIWRSESYDSAIFGDASADCVSIVGTEFCLGNATTNTPQINNDGDGETQTWQMPDITTSYTLKPFAAVPTNGYLWGFTTVGTVASAIAINPASITGTPAGNDTYVQFNDGGAFGAEAAFAYDKTTDYLSVPVVDCTSVLAEAQVYAGDATHSGSFRQYDGDGEYTTFAIGDVLANWTWTWPTAAPGVTEMLTMTSGGAVDHAAIPVDTDTDYESYTILTATAVVLSTSYQQIGNSYAVDATGTVVYSSLIFNTWTVNAGADTVTVQLRVDGAETDTWTTTVGATGGYGGAFSQAVTVADATNSHYISIWAKKTSSGTTDAISVSNSVVRVQIK